MNMEPLTNKLNEKLTIKKVEEHLQSFLKIRHFYSVIEIDEVDICNFVYKRKRDYNTENRMLKKVLKTDYINSVTKEYIEKMLQAINGLDRYDRTLILCKYFFEMDDEELCEYVNVSSRKAWSDLRNAKMSLAFLLGCEIYK